MALILSLSPTHVSLLGTEGSCGVPLYTSFVDTSQADDFGLSDQCRQQLVIRLVEAGAVMLTVGLTGLCLIIFAPSKRAEQQRQFQQWQAWQQQQENARQWADYQQRLAEWERLNGPQQL